MQADELRFRRRAPVCVTREGHEARRVIAGGLAMRQLVELVGGGFDLDYRLKVVELRVPVLRPRRDDILPLARVLLAGATRLKWKITTSVPRLPNNLSKLERDYIVAALEMNRGNRARTAEPLQVGTATLHPRVRATAALRFSGVGSEHASEAFGGPSKIAEGVPNLVARCGPRKLAMEIRVNIDANIDDREKLADYVARVVESSLRRFGARVDRVDVHLGDERGNEEDKHRNRCSIEARVEGHQPTVVVFQADAPDTAVDGATDRLEHSLANLLEQPHDDS